jgi:endoglycosylceramidase
MRATRTLATSAVALAIALSLAAPAPAAAPGPATFTSRSMTEGPREPLHSAGRWIVDATGRVVIFHGTNLVPPGPPGTPADFGVGTRHLRFLADQGFRLIRFGTFYENVEPEPGKYDRGHIRELAEYARRIHDAGMFVMLDVHQDVYSPRYGGRGFPEWMVHDDGLPNQPQLGFPGNYFANLATNRAWDNFWADVPAADGIGIQAHFARGWELMARRFAFQRGVLGYDILNEPWPGTVWPLCASPSGCPPGGFDQTTLTEFSRRIADSIRASDPHRVIFAEPNLQFDVGAATGLGSIDDPNAGLSFHDYCLGAAPGLPRIPDPAGICEVGEQLVIDNAEVYSRRTGAALILTEFSDTKDPAVALRLTDIMDRAMMPWTFWSYWAAAGQILIDPEKPPAPSNLEQPLLDAVVRPYPYVVAGTPTSYGFDHETKTFTLELAATPVEAGRRLRNRISEIVLPRRVYPRGRYDAAVRGARVLSRRHADTLVLKTRRTAERVSVEVSRAVPG